MRAVEKLLKNVYRAKLVIIPLITQASKAPVASTPWKHKSQGGIVSWFWLWTWDHTGPGALKQNKWTQTQRQLDEWETELYLPASLIFLIHPYSRFHIINTMTATLILRPLTGPAVHCIYSPPRQKKARFCFVYTRWVNLQWQRGAITCLTVSSWISRVVRSWLVITGRCQNTNKLQSIR